MKSSAYNLSIDRTFCKIWVPFSQEELQKTLCTKPIITYSRTIVSGFISYEYCRLHKIPYSYEERNFFSLDEAVTYACLESLKQTDLTDEKFRYCIGRLYHAQKRLLTQHLSQPVTKNQSCRTTAALLPDSTTLSRSSICKYSLYSAAIDEIDRKAPEIADSLLQGHLKLSQANTLALSRLSPEGIRIVCDRIKNGEDASMLSDAALKKRPKRHAAPRTSGLYPEIKQMPKYDPDAELSSLTLTIPMWISSINRTKSLTKFHEVSADALVRLEEQLIRLRQCTEEMQLKIQEEYHA